MNEIWKDVVGYEGSYQISNHGNVRSVDRYITYPDGHRQFVKGKDSLFINENTCGYQFAKLKNKTKYIHIMVAEAFVDGWFEGAEVNHKDLNKHNNVASNLEWITHSENQKHQYNLYHPNREQKVCKICGAKVSGVKVRHCPECEKKIRREGWQSKEELAEEILKYSIEEIGRIHNCSGSAIWKRLKAYELPSSRKEIIEYQKEHGVYVPPRRANVKPFEKRYKMYEIDGMKKTANAWSNWLGLDSKRIGRYANKHTYHETLEYIKSFMK